MGKLATQFGPRRVFLAGAGILLVAGLVGAFAPGFGVLLLSRALIGIGTSAGYPTAMALVRRRADRTGAGVPSRVLGNFSIAAQITVVVGLPLGGVLAGAFGWRALFLVNVPLALITLACTLLGVEPDPPRDRTGALRALDLPGIALFAGAVVALLVFLGGLTHPAWWLLAVAAATAALLVAWERRVAQPLIDVRMLAANKPLQRTYARQFLIGLGVYTSLYGTSQWMQAAGGHSATAVGLIMVPLSAVSIVVARLASNRGWVRWPLLIGAADLIVTAAAMRLLDRTAGIVLLLGLSVLIGLINGFSGFANQATLYLDAPAEQIATAAGLFRTAAYVGAIFSAGIIAIAYGDRVTDGGFHRLAAVIGALGVVSVLLTALDRRIPVTTAVRD
jgi:hypothetical protein